MLLTALGDGTIAQTLTAELAEYGVACGPASGPGARVGPRSWLTAITQASPVHNPLWRVPGRL